MASGTERAPRAGLAPQQMVIPSDRARRTGSITGSDGSRPRVTVLVEPVDACRSRTFERRCAAASGLLGRSHDVANVSGRGRHKRRLQANCLAAVDRIKLRRRLTVQTPPRFRRLCEDGDAPGKQPGRYRRQTPHRASFARCSGRPGRSTEGACARPARDLIDRGEAMSGASTGRHLPAAPWSPGARRGAVTASTRSGRCTAGCRRHRKSPVCRGFFRSRPVSRILSWVTISLGRQLPDGSSGVPGSSAGRVDGTCFALHRTGFGEPPCHHGAGGLLPHPFTLTGSVSPGGLLSVPLSIGFRRLGFPQRPALWCPDFPRAPPKRRPRSPGLHDGR